MEPGRGLALSWKHWRSDMAASLVVFLVALPLCMGIALASGMPPASGLLTGIIGGLVVGWIAGSPLQVSGPAAGLVVLVFDIVHRRGLEDLALILIVAGALQVAAGCFRLAQWFRVVSPAVIQGMLAGIGALILVGQLHVMLGKTPHASGLQNLISLPETIWYTLVPPDGSLPFSALIGLLTIAVLIGWKDRLKKAIPLPATLIAVLLAGVVAFAFGLSIRYVEVPQSLDGMVRLISLDTLGNLRDGQILMYAVAVALIASAESLLSATAVDQLQRGPRTKYDRELAAQGVGNVLCGILGGLPMTGVIVRSSANIQAGARTRLAAVLHGVWILAFVALLPGLLSFVPVASLAAILVYTGYKLISVRAIKELLHYGKGEVVIYAITFLTIIVEDLLTGVVIGVVLSGLKLLYVFSRLHVRLESTPDQSRTILHLGGAATFLRLPQLASALERVPASGEMHVQFENLDYIDHACLDLLMNWAKQHQSKGGKLIIDWDSLHACFRQDAAPSTAAPTPPMAPHAS